MEEPVKKMQAQIVEHKGHNYIQEVHYIPERKSLIISHGKSGMALSLDNWNNLVSLVRGVVNTPNPSNLPFRYIASMDIPSNPDTEDFSVVVVLKRWVNGDHEVVYEQTKKTPKEYEGRVALREYWINIVTEKFNATIL